MIEPIRRLAFRMQPPRQIFKRSRRRREINTKEFERLLDGEMEKRRREDEG